MSANTFNLGLVFQDNLQKVVCIIACYSDKPINKAHIQASATNHLQIGMMTGRNMQALLGFIMDGIRKECGVQTVLVNADVACVISAVQE